MRPSIVVATHRDAILATVARFGTSNPRIFGSVLNGTDCDGSDLDILVETKPGVTLIELGGLLEALESLLGVAVDLCTPEDFPPVIRTRLLAEAKPI